MSVQEVTAVFTVSVVVMYAIRLYLWCRWLFYVVFIALAYQFYPWSFLPLLYVWRREMFYGVIIALGHQFYSWWIVLPLLYYCFLGTVATPAVFWKQFFYGVIIALGYQLYSWWRERRRAEEELRSDYSRYQYSQQRLEKDEIRRYTAKNSNNHDHLKFKHGTRQGAQAEVDRMRRQGYKDSERLNVYYNADLKGWFVGRGWKPQHSLRRWCVEKDWSDSDY